jgi:hypothetical protein
MVVLIEAAFSFDYQNFIETRSFNWRRIWGSCPHAVSFKKIKAAVKVTLTE